MKKNVFFMAAVFTMIVLMYASCSSTPDGTAIAEAKGKAEQAKQQAMDFDSPGYFPSEWEEIETRFNAAETVEDYDAAAADFDEIFRKTIPLYAQAREDEIISAREQLIGSGFTRYFPDYLKKADDLALAAQGQYEAGDYYKARDTAAEALTEYETLQLGARVFIARQEIMDRDFVRYDPDNFLRADTVTRTAMEAYEAGNREDAIANAEEALLRYNIVLSNGWPIYAAERRELVVAERENALAERVNIASRDIFREAESVFNQAEEVFASDNLNDAAILFTDAEALFAIARQDTRERRVRAEEAIRMAEEKIEESNEAAAEAERLIEGGTR
jgi:tetratricopeptide (TPR) repeat protein